MAVYISTTTVKASLAQHCLLHIKYTAYKVMSTTFIFKYDIFTCDRKLLCCHDNFLLICCEQQFSSVLTSHLQLLTLGLHSLRSCRDTDRFEIFQFISCQWLMERWNKNLLLHSDRKMKTQMSIKTNTFLSLALFFFFFYRATVDPKFAAMALTLYFSHKVTLTKKSF